MADPEHLAILDRGYEAVREWVTERRKPMLDLRGADLRGRDLSGLDVHEIAFEPGPEVDDYGFYIARRADFRGANLSESMLVSTSLLGARMAGANLERAILDRADLSHVDLTGANLTGASLRYAVLDGTILEKATLTGVTFGGTIFSAVGLSGALGLDSSIHRSPSSVDIQTLLKSGPLPENFLRGCGLPEDFIRFLPSLLGAEPLQFYSCFISHSAKDEAFATRLFKDLQSHGIRCWFSPMHMRIGEKVRAGIDEAIRSYDKLLLILSDNSVHSDWVAREVERALERERRTGIPVLFPIRIDDAIEATSVDWAADVRMIHIGDFRNWRNLSSYGAAFSRLVRDLKQRTRLPSR